MPKIVLTERDYKWLIAFLVLCFVFTFALFFGGKDKEIVDYVGFASTMISIILSVLAIMWSFYTSGGAAAQTDKLIKASEQLDKAMAGFQVSHAQLAAATDSFGLLGRQMENVDKRVSALAQMMGKGQEVPAASDTANSPADELALKVVSHSGLLALYIAVKNSQQPTKRSLASLLDQIRKASSIPLTKEYIWGFLVGFRSSGIVGNTSVEPTFMIKVKDPDRLQTLIEAEYTRRVKGLKPASQKKMTAAFQTIDAIYSGSEDDSDEQDQDPEQDDTTH